MTQASTVALNRGVKLDRRRYIRVLFFFGRIFLDLLWWEVLLRQLLGKKYAARHRPQRLRRYAHQFRQLAVRMGGVMIKLGQFVSARVDVMPHEITDELAGLQDEVPPEPLEVILGVVQEEMGVSPDDLFVAFETETRAAASLGQVHRARLKSGEHVAVKIQRPGIEITVATDLEALHVVARWAMAWPVIRKRADVPALLQEFARTLWEELDYVSEAANAERFAELFADDHRVYIPAIYREYSTRRVLTMEDVTSIKITDQAAVKAAGVDQAVAARRLLDMYLRMIFEFGFFHADPHPGNLFIYPLPAETPAEDLELHPAGDGRPFYVIFVDFGMVGHITDKVRAGLREALVAIGTRDTRRLLKAYQMLGVLLPSADLERIEQAEAEVLGYIWGKSIPELARMSHQEMREFAIKYRDLLYELPFQVPQDFIYLARAVGILSGICTMLDPEFNPWEPVAQYAQQFVAQEANASASLLIDEALALAQIAVSLPRQLQDVLTRFQHGDIDLRISAGKDFSIDLHRLRQSVDRLVQSVVFAGLLVSSTLLYTDGQITPGLIGFGLAGLALLLLLFRPRRNEK